MLNFQIFRFRDSRVLNNIKFSEDEIFRFPDFYILSYCQVFRDSNFQIFDLDKVKSGHVRAGQVLELHVSLLSDFEKFKFPDF